MRSGEHLVATPTGVFKVSTIRRMASDRRWSAQMVKAIVGSPEEQCPEARADGSQHLRSDSK